MKALLLILLVVAVLLLVALVRTLMLPHKKSGYEPPPADDRALQYARLLSEMVQCETISVAGKAQPEKFERFQQRLAELFPLVFQNMEQIALDGNLLLKWHGKSAEKPILFLSHQDVVAAEGEWTYPPFSGTIADGKVWGRGTADIKCGLVSFLQAAEELLAQGFQPDDDVYLAGSCTEEVGGDGGPTIVSYLKSQGVKMYMVCDEGGCITTEPLKGIPGNFAMIALAEKGYADIEMASHSAGGHAMLPPKNSPLIRLAGFEMSMEKHSPFKKRIPKTIRYAMAQLAPYATSFGQRLLLGNIWLFQPVLKQCLGKYSPQFSANLQTTAAFTMQRGSNSSNAMPTEAAVTINLRFCEFQGETESLALLKARGEKYGLSMKVLRSNDYKGTVDVKSAAYSMVENAIHTCFPGLGIVPFILPGGTDAKYFQSICDNVFRFCPTIGGVGFHGIDERLDYACLPAAVDYYKYLMKAPKPADKEA